MSVKPKRKDPVFIGITVSIEFKGCTAVLSSIIACNFASFNISSISGFFNWGDKGITAAPQPTVAKIPIIKFRPLAAITPIPIPSLIPILINSKRNASVSINNS